MRGFTLALVLLAPALRAEEEHAICPSGTRRALTQDPYQPFICEKEEKKSGFGAVLGPQGFKERPKCPRGSRAAASSDGLQPYRCVRVLAADADPILLPMGGDEEAPAPQNAEADPDPLTRGCPAGKRKVRTADPLRPFQCVTQASRIGPLSDDEYRRYTIPGVMSFEYPRMLQPRDGWKEDVPTLSFTLDDGSPGKPVTLTITKADQSQPTFIDLDTAIAKDKDWQGARDGGSLLVAGIKARITFVAGESKTAYLPLSKETYYAVMYSAPTKAYEIYLSSFNHLLKTLRLTRKHF